VDEWRALYHRLTKPMSELPRLFARRLPYAAALALAASFLARPALAQAQTAPPPPDAQASSEAAPNASPTPTPTPTPPKRSSLDVEGSMPLRPGHVDVRVLANSDILLAFVGVGAAADVGIAPAGPGTLALGVGAEYAFCGTVCWLLNTVTPLSFSHTQLSLSVRGTYHLGLAKNLDVYPLVTAGPTIARSSVKLDDGSGEYRGRDTGITVGAGGGINYFLADHFFLGGEARLRYGRGTYSYELVAGNNMQTLTEGSVQTWSLTGLDISLAAGVRF
jgi:hypothetical protein